MEVLKVLMEDAGCERLDEECLKNLFKLVEENKYPKLDEEEKNELDNELSDQLTKHRFTNPSLAEQARKLGLTKTANALSGAEFTEVKKPTLEEELGAMKEERVAPIKEVAPSQRVVVVSKGGKGSLILSSIALIVSLFTVAAIFGFIRVPNLTLAKEKDLLNLQSQIMSLQTNYIILKNELIKVSSLTKTEISLLKLKLKALNNTISMLQSDLMHKIEELKTSIGKLDQRLKAQEELSLELASKVGNLEQNEKELRKELITLQYEIKNETKSFKEQIKTLEGKLDELYSKLESVNRELEALNATTNTKIESIMKKYEEEIAKLQNELLALKTKIDMFEAKLEKIKVVNKYISILEDKIKELSMKLAQINKINTELKYLKEEVASLNATINKLPKTLNKINVKQKELSLKVAELESQLNGLSEEIKNINYKLENIKKDVRKEVIKLLESPQVFNIIYNALLNKYHLDQKIAKLVLLNNTAFRIAVENIATSVCLKMMQGNFRGLVVTG